MLLFRTCHIFFIRLVLSFLLIFTMGKTMSFAQRTNAAVFSQKDFLFSNMKVVTTDSGFTIVEIIRENCKGSYTEIIGFPEAEVQSVLIPVPVAALPAKPKFLIIHGNISYDYFYRSKIDTPFNQQDLQQHTERVNLNVLVKEKYPLNVSFSSRQSNSPFFRNFLDANFQFDKYGYLKNIKKILLDKVNTQIPQPPDLKNAEAQLKEEIQKLEKLKAQLEDPWTLQKIIEERERIYFEKIKAQKEKDIAAVKQKNIPLTIKDSIYAAKANDSLAGKLGKDYQTKKKEVLEAEKKIDQLKQRFDSLKSVSQKDLASVRQKIYKARNEEELKKIALENGLEMEKSSGFVKQLSYIKTLSLGRSVLNYTELTAQNIIITGINVEYNSSRYAAFAAGKIDYRFRDFFNRRSKNNDQYITLGRFGFGDKDKKAVIFTLFKGRKSQSDAVISDTIKSHVDIVGYSVETIYKKDENTFLSAEFAKSTKPVSGNIRENKQMSPLIKFDDRTNMGINLKAQTVIPETDTKLSGFFRKTGENFQSFSLFSYNTDQTAWLARADQSFLKKKVGLTAMLRRNDFVNPFTEKTYKTSTVFKSVLLNVRVPKYPSLSFGYYPGTQLYIVDKETIRENAYYILNGSLVYSYFVKGTGMNTSLIYNRYMNKASDSGFVLYKGINYYASQTFFLKRLQLQGGYAYTKQPELKYATLESSADYSFRKILKLGAGIKYNKVYGGQSYWGERAIAGADLKKLGTIQFQYEKAYLPTISQTLYPVETGRISWYKSF